MEEMNQCPSGVSFRGVSRNATSNVRRWRQALMVAHRLTPLVSFTTRCYTDLGCEEHGTSASNK
jgi:hypothetical protein